MKFQLSVLSVFLIKYFGLFNDIGSHNKVQFSRLWSFFVLNIFYQFYKIFIFISTIVFVLLRDILNSRFLNVFVKLIRESNVLATAKAHVREIDKHHDVFFFWDFIRIVQIKKFENIRIELFVFWSAEVPQRWNEFFETYPVVSWKLFDQIVNTMTPQSLFW